MDVSEARELLSVIRAERDTARESIKVAEAILESSQLIVQGLVRRYPELASEATEIEWKTDSPTTRLRGADAVLSILQVEEDNWMSVKEMVSALAERGLLPESENPANAVRTALERLVAAEDSGVEKGRYGGTVVYRYTEIKSYPEDEEPF